MHRSLPGKPYVAIALTVLFITLFLIVLVSHLVTEVFDKERQPEMFLVLSISILACCISAMAALMITSYSMRESSDSEKGSLAIGSLKMFEKIFRQALSCSDKNRRDIYLTEADQFLENACSLHDTIRCRYQRANIKRRLHSIFALAAADGLPLNRVENLNSWAGYVEGVRKAGLSSLRTFQQSGELYPVDTSWTPETTKPA